MMKNISANLIVESIKKVTGKGPHQLHEPLFFGKEISYLNNTINKNFVSSSGEYVNKFEKKIMKYTKVKFAVAVVNGTQAIYISLKACGVNFSFSPNFFLIFLKSLWNTAEFNFF